MTKKQQIIFQLLANTIPLAGYWFYDWNMFAIIYMYWAEGFITAFFSCSKVALAKGIDEGQMLPSPLSTRLFSALKYLFFRSLVLLFYWIFIFAFVAFPGGEINKTLALQNMMVLSFADTVFNSALLAYFLTQLVLFISDFFISGEYRLTGPGKYKVLFDARTIVLHIVIVLGTFSYQYLRQYESISNRLPGLAYVGILFVLKSLADIIQYKMNKPIALTKQ